MSHPVGTLLAASYRTPAGPLIVVVDPHAAGDLGPEAALKTLRDIAPTGSGAEKLFKLGSPEPAPAGRADDLSAPAP